MKLYPILRTLLFKLEPEQAHQLTLSLIRSAGSIGPIYSMLHWLFHTPTLPVQAFGLNFANPIGLAAGYDKDGLGWRGLTALGFGHIEVGTVTPQAQSGNPKPRLFRLIDEQALINRMGFPSRGEQYVLRKLHGSRASNVVLGVNIGKNKYTPLESACADYVRLLQSFTPYVDYLTINISSPNTVGLRRLQERQALDQLLRQLIAEREKLARIMSRKPPLLVKLAPDLSDAELDEALEVILENQMDGVIASNTTLSRQGLSSPLASESGGLSGKPLFKRSLEMVSRISQRTGRKLPVVGVGGIFNATGVQQMLDAGAILVQIYTGLVYEGPGLVSKIMRALTRQA